MSFKDPRDGNPVRRTQRQSDYEPKIDGLSRIDKATGAQITKLESGRLLVAARGQERLCENDTQVAAAIAELSQPEPTPKPQRMLVPFTDGPLKRRAIQHNAKIDADEAAERQREQAVADRKQLAAETAAALHQLDRQPQPPTDVPPQDLQRVRAERDQRIATARQQMLDVAMDGKSTPEQRSAARDNYFSSFERATESAGNSSNEAAT